MNTCQGLKATPPYHSKCVQNLLIDYSHSNILTLCPKINVIYLREMLNSALGTLVKIKKIEISCWKVMKKFEFNFLKIKKLLFSMQNYSFWFL